MFSRKFPGLDHFVTDFVEMSDIQGNISGEFAVPRITVCQLSRYLDILDPYDVVSLDLRDLMKISKSITMDPLYVLTIMT